MLRKGWKPAIALALMGFFANAQTAQAGCDNGKGNNYTNNGVGNGSCSTGAGSSVQEAPLPLLGASPFALMAIVGGAIIIYRRNRATA